MYNNFRIIKYVYTNDKDIKIYWENISNSYNILLNIDNEVKKYTTDQSFLVINDIPKGNYNIHVFINSKEDMIIFFTITINNGIPIINYLINNNNKLYFKFDTINNFKEKNIIIYNLSKNELISSTYNEEYYLYHSYIPLNLNIIIKTPIKGQLFGTF